MQNTIIYLIGLPGVGKYTIAKEIARQSNFRVVDSHLINNVLFSLIQCDGKIDLPPNIWSNIGKIWSVVLDTITNFSPQEFNFVLTNALFEGKAGDRKWFDQIEKTAQARKARFIPVRLLCTAEEHERRIVMPERAARFKLIDPDSVRRFSQGDEVLKLTHPNALTLDISQMAPHIAAQKIFGHIEKSF